MKTAKVGDKMRFTGSPVYWNGGDIQITDIVTENMVRGVSLSYSQYTGDFYLNELEPLLPVSSGESINLLPTGAADRKAIPIASGVLDYFPAALIEVAKVSRAGNIQHNGPDAPLFWARGKSMDQDNTLIRHFLERGKIDSDGILHSAKLAWRALAILQLELEAAGAPVARGARLPQSENSLEGPDVLKRAGVKS